MPHRIRRFFFVSLVIACLSVSGLWSQDRDRHRHHRHHVDVQIDGIEIAEIVADALREARLALRSVDVELEVREALREADMERTVREALRESRRSIREAQRDVPVDVYVAGVDLAEILEESLRAAEIAVDSIPIERIVEDSVRSVDVEHIVKDVLRGLERALRAVDHR